MDHAPGGIGSQPPPYVSQPLPAAANTHPHPHPHPHPHAHTYHGASSHPVSSAPPPPPDLQLASAPTLWQYFKRGDKMQKTNKFEANCIFCFERQGVLTKVRGEKRMMAGHLRNCPNASPQAKAEGQAVALELKSRRASASRQRSNAPGVKPSLRKSKGRMPLHANPLMGAPAVGPAGAVAAGLPLDANSTAVVPGAAGNPGPGPGPPQPDYAMREHAAPSGFVTNDGVRLYYEERGSGHPLVLIHGWSGSSKCFVRNFETLSQSFRVIQYDLRGHGESDKPQWGFHVHRLAADLNNLLDHLRLEHVALLGCSLGCAVIWAYVELHGVGRISAAMFVDQSPWQMVAPDGSWQYGSSGAFSESAIACLSARLEENPQRCHEKNVRMCLNQTPDEHETNFFVSESLKAQPWFLSKLMADHANMDWRAVLELVTCPALVIVGKRSKVFPWQGVAYAANKMPQARLIEFDEGSHWLYYEESDRFNMVVTTFLSKLTDNAPVR